MILLFPLLLRRPLSAPQRDASGESVAWEPGRYFFVLAHLVIIAPKPVETPETGLPSVARTNRVIVATEEVDLTSFGRHLYAWITQHLFWDLDNPAVLLSAVAMLERGFTESQCYAAWRGPLQCRQHSRDSGGCSPKRQGQTERAPLPWSGALGPDASTMGLDNAPHDVEAQTASFNGRCRLQAREELEELRQFLRIQA